MTELLTIKEVSEILKVSYETALMYVKQNSLAIKVGRQYRVSKDKLAAHINKQISGSPILVKLNKGR